ncbi:MAG: replication-associated recombination protein A [Actinomycetota bacterium]
MPGPDLFSEATDRLVAARAPLAARMRPRTLDDVVGQSHLTDPGSALRRLIESDRVSSVILWGPPGTGKTTIAELIASGTRRVFERLSAVTTGVKDVREVIEAARNRTMIDGTATVVFIDEIHRFTTTQQDSLLHAVETGLLTLVGATTENPAHAVNPALRSRSSVFRLEPVDESDIVPLLARAVALEGADATTEALAVIARRCTGDVRQALTALEVAMSIASGPDGAIRIGIEHAAAALDTAVSRLGRNDHYDVISGFIKSMRAGETDVAIHWLARMIESGEDPRFIARRMVIFASEDIGHADPSALQVAVAAAQALELVGLPEAAINLAHAVVHLSRAPKSRSVVDAVGSALEDVRTGRTGAAPPSSSEPPAWRPLGFDVPRYYRDGDR